MKNILSSICSFISIFLWFFGLGGIISPIFLTSTYTSLTFFIGIIFMLLGLFFRKLSLRTIDKEYTAIIMFMDISLIGILQTLSVIIELAVNLQFEKSPLPRLTIFLASTFSYIKLRKIYNLSEYKDKPYRTPIILLIMIGIVYIPLTLLIDKSLIDIEFITLLITLLVVVIIAIIYETIKTAKHTTTIPKPIKFVLNKTLLIVLSLLSLFGLIMAQEVGKDVVSKFLGDGMTKEERMMNRTVNKTNENEAYSKEIDISGDIITNIKKEIGGIVATGNIDDRTLKEEYEIFEELNNVENIEHTISRVQLRLMIEGYYTDEVDGILGEKTKEALMMFQEDNFSFSTGALNLGTLKALGIIK